MADKVILCGVFDDELPDVFGPFSSETDAKNYLDNKHANPGWNAKPTGVCFGEVESGAHVIVDVFK